MATITPDGRIEVESPTSPGGRKLFQPQDSEPSTAGGDKPASQDDGKAEIERSVHLNHVS